MMGELTVVVRILLYVAAGWLLQAGLPPAVVDMITTDPGVADLISQAVAALLAVAVYAWSRLAKRMGWTT